MQGQNIIVNKKVPKTVKNNCLYRTVLKVIYTISKKFKSKYVMSAVLNLYVSIRRR